MLDRLVETFCDFDDFCKSIKPQWEALLLTDGTKPKRKHGPECGLVDSEIMTLLVLYHSSHFKNFKAFYNGIVLGLVRGAKFRAGVDFFLAPTRCGLIQPPCGRPARHRWSAAGRAEAVASEAAGEQRRAEAPEC